MASARMESSVAMRSSTANRVARRSAMPQFCGDLDRLRETQ